VVDDGALVGAAVLGGTLFGGVYAGPGFE